VTAVDQVEITEPAAYDGFPEDLYHQHPALSASGARLLLPPSCPAQYRWVRDHPLPPKPTYDRGHGVHRLVLGVGPEIEVIDAADWRTKAAREARDAAHAAGKVPLLAHQHEHVQAMAAALRAHPVAGELLDPDRMEAEKSIFWRDEQTGVMRRARLDAVSRPDRAGGVVVVDVKTTRSASVEHLSRALWEYGYGLQGSWYQDGAVAVGLAEEAPTFLLVAVEVDPPHLVSVVEPDATALYVGRQQGRQAIDIYAECVRSGQWPGHVPDNEIPLVSMPGWAERRYINDQEDVI
jgi:PDDEXK-like uncharacterized protein DUF3799